MCFILLPQVPSSCSRACAKAKLIHCVTQPQITLGIRAFLIPLLILVLYNWGALQICFFLREDNRSCSESLAFHGAWACLLQPLELDPGAWSWDPSSGVIYCRGTRAGSLGHQRWFSVANQVSPKKQGTLLWRSALPHWEVMLGAQLGHFLACRPASSWEVNFFRISRNCLGWHCGKYSSEKSTHSADRIHQKW